MKDFTLKVRKHKGKWEVTCPAIKKLKVRDRSYLDALIKVPFRIEVIKRGKHVETFVE